MVVVFGCSSIYASFQLSNVSVGGDRSPPFQYLILKKKKREIEKIKYPICLSWLTLPRLLVCWPVKRTLKHQLYHQPPLWYTAQPFSLSLSLIETWNFLLNIFFLLLGTELHSIVVPSGTGDSVGVAGKCVAEGRNLGVEPSHCQNIVISWTNLHSH